MNSRFSPKILPALALALALQIPSQASACRVGWDQHLFEKSPPAGALAGARILRVRFSNARPAVDKWPQWAASPDGGPLGYSLIGVARRLDRKASGAEPFPVYAFVTSCSGFWAAGRGDPRKVVEGVYYLIGRFASGGPGRRFLAGGRRMHGGGDLYGGWHF